MSKVKLGFNKLSVPNKIQQSRNIITKMTGNAALPAPNPTLATLTTAVDSLEAAYEAASDGGKAKTAFMYTQEKALDALMVQLAAYVQQASAGNATIILSSGMDVAAGRTPSQDLPAPEAVAAITGQNEGEVLLKWKPVKGAASYIVQQSADGSTGWALAANSTKASSTVSGLVSGSKEWFRVAAIGAKGQGPWSAPAKGMAG